MVAQLRGLPEPILTRDVLNTMGAADVRAIAIKAGVAEHASTATCIDRLVSLQRQVTKGKQGPVRKPGPKVQGWTKRRIVQSLAYCAPRMSLAELQQLAPFMQRHLPDIYERELDLAHAELRQQTTGSNREDEQSGVVVDEDRPSIKLDLEVLAEESHGECLEYEEQHVTSSDLDRVATAEPPPLTESDQSGKCDGTGQAVTVCCDAFQVPFDHIFTGPAEHYPSTIRIQMVKKVRGGMETFWTLTMAGRRGLRCRTRREVQYDSEDEARDAFFVMHETLQACGLSLTHAAKCQSDVLESMLVD